MMRLTDIVQHADLSVWAEAAMVLFMASFAVIGVRALCSDRGVAEEMAATPLEDDTAFEQETRL